MLARRRRHIDETWSMTTRLITDKR